jgi:hypothetical protein
MKKPFTGIELVANERARQIADEGFTAEHDAQHVNGEMMRAALGYLLELRVRRTHGGKPRKNIPPGWPWDKASWKPTKDEIRQLTKVGALVVAELDLLLSQQEVCPTCEGSKTRIIPTANGAFSTACPDCKGTGKQ